MTAAFDKLNHNYLWKSIRNRLKSGTNTKIINLLENLYSTTAAEIKGDIDTNFEMETGVFQGGPESPILYNLYMDYVMRIFMENAKEEKIMFISHNYRIPEYASITGAEMKGKDHVTWSGYADDLALYLDTNKDLDKASKLLDKVFDKYQLCINYKKLKR